MRVELACSLVGRLRGLLGRGRYPDVLLLMPCNDVHTFGMRYDIDVAFVSSEGLVLASHREVGACRRLHCKEAFATFERIADGADWLEQGETVNLKEIVQEAIDERRRRI